MYKMLTNLTMLKRVHQDDTVIRAIEELETSGIALFHIYTQMELKEKNQAILNMVRNYPEFETSSDHPVMGAFGAHATPSSYHHPTVQAIRMDVFERFHSIVIPIVARKHGFSFWHTLFDRVCTRGPESGSIGAESWHFDFCDDVKNSNIGDKQLTGGWINLNVDQDQYFFGLKGEFGTDYLPGGKYTPLPKSNFAKFEKQLTLQGGPIIVPPGWMICFKPEVVHKVNPGKTSKLGVRLYMGTVMSNVEKPLFNFGREQILANELGFTGSGQRPATWDSMSWTFRPEQIETWTEKMKPNSKYLETVRVNPKGKGKNAGKTFTRAKRFMIEPVQIYGYTDEALNIMLPMVIE